MSSPASVRRVHGMQPTDVKPNFASGCGGNPADFAIAATSTGEMRASGVELEARSVLFNHRNMRALTALVALASVQPGREWRRCVGERLCAAGIGIGKPKVRIKVALLELVRVRRLMMRRTTGLLT